MTMVKSCVASGRTPLVACAVSPEYVPGVVGEPVSELPTSITPGGNVPVTENAGAGAPVAVKVWLY